MWVQVRPHTSPQDTAVVKVEGEMSGAGALQDWPAADPWLLQTLEPESTGLNRILYTGPRRHHSI